MSFIDKYGCEIEEESPYELTADEMSILKMLFDVGEAITNTTDSFPCVDFTGTDIRNLRYKLLGEG